MVMDELPDLASDADVDALMARLRARLDPPAAASPSEPARQEFVQAFDELVAAHEGLAASMVRAMEVIVGTLEEFSLELQPAAVPAPAVVAPVRRERAAARRPARTTQSRRTRR